ncbi:MAG: helix-turn-helix transcriptional regulator [Chitinophagaceae bacterium]|nr:helix-turn-helix transcriptional regulator [Chitinophagaceae bacterium]
MPFNKKANGKTSIESLSLTVSDKPVDFVIKTMQQVEQEHNGHDVLPHRHNYYTIIWVKKGKGTHHIDFKTYEVKENIIFFISPEQVHHLTMEPGHDGYVLLFTPDFTERHGIAMTLIQQGGFFSRCDDVAPLYINSPHYELQLEQYLQLMCREYKNKGPFHHEMLGSLLKMFLLECKRMADAAVLPRESRNHPKAGIIRQFKTLLDDRFKEWHKVSDYAEELHITPNYLNEVLSQETGISAKDFILNRIMLEAKRYATYSELSAKEVGYELGFDDPAHFSKLFKQQQKESFSGFRDSIRKKYN